MNDPRETPSNGRVAHVSLRGKVAAEAFVDGEAMQVAVPATDITDADGTRRERELLLGDGFLVLDRVDGRAFGMAGRDGYVGWVSSDDLGPAAEVTHVVDVARSYAKARPELKAFEPVTHLSFGARVAAGLCEDDWVQIAVGPAPLWMPAGHLRPAGTVRTDPVEVARMFLGTPYLWGGNSAFGLDCSGLIQAAMLACGVPCPGDSDQQADRLGAALPPDADLQAGDLVFWDGHVGILSDPDTLVHANAHHMRATEEPLDVVTARIRAADGGEITVRRRVAGIGGDQAPTRRPG